MPGRSGDLAVSKTDLYEGDIDDNTSTQLNEQGRFRGQKSLNKESDKIESKWERGNFT